MQRCQSLEISSIPELKRRRLDWLSQVRKGSYGQFRFLDLSDDVLMVVMRRLLPNKNALRGRDLAAYRDVSNLAFTCRRLLKLFRMVRTIPQEVYGLFDQIAIDPSSLGQIRYPPVADIRFFQNLMAESGSHLRRLTVPFLPSTQTSTFVKQLLLVCFHLNELAIADAGTLLYETRELLSTSRVDHLKIYYPTRNTMASLILSEKERGPRWSWHCCVSSHTCDYHIITAVMKHSGLHCKYQRRRWVVKLKDCKSGHGILATVFSLFINRLSEIKLIERRETKHESHLFITVADFADLESLLTEKAATANDFQQARDDVPRALYIRSNRALDLYLNSSLTQKESIRNQMKRAYHVDVRVSLEDTVSATKLCKCLEDLLEEENDVRSLLISREIVFFSSLPEVLPVLTRFNALIRIQLTDRVEAVNTTSHALSDLRFLDQLPIFLDILRKNCKHLEAVNMSLCFARFPSENREELGPRINRALDALANFEDATNNIGVAGIRRVLLSWLQRVNLERQIN